MKLMGAQRSGELQGKFTCKQEPGSGGPAGAMGEGLWIRGNRALERSFTELRSLGGRREVTCGVREEKFRAQGTQVPGEGPTWAVTQQDRHTVQVGSAGLVASHKVCPRGSWEYLGASQRESSAERVSR